MTLEDEFRRRAEIPPPPPGTSGGTRWDQDDSHPFDYGSLDGPWRTPGDWLVESP